MIPKASGFFNYKLITNPQRSDTLVMAFKFKIVER